VCCFSKFPPVFDSHTPSKNSTNSKQLTNRQQTTHPGCFHQHNNHSHSCETFMTFCCRTLQAAIQQLRDFQHPTASQLLAVKLCRTSKGARKHQKEFWDSCLAMSMGPNRCKETWDCGVPRHTHASTTSGVCHELLTQPF